MKKSDFPNDNFRGRLSPLAVERLLEVRNAILAGDPRLYRQGTGNVPQGEDHCQSAGCIFGWLIYLDVVLHGGTMPPDRTDVYVAGARILGLHAVDGQSWMCVPGGYGKGPEDRSLAALIYYDDYWPEGFRLPGFSSQPGRDERDHGAAFIDWVISIYSEANSPAV